MKELPVSKVDLAEDAEVPKNHPQEQKYENGAPAATPDLLGSPAGNDSSQ